MALIAYFLAHTLHRTATADSSQEIKTSLQVQQQEIDSLKQQLANNRAEDAEKRKRRLAIRNQLGVFLDQGKRLQQDIEYSNLSALHEKSAWEKRVEEYLAKELDSSYAARFRSPLRVPVSYPRGNGYETGRSLDGRYGEDRDAEYFHLRTAGLAEI